MGLLVVQRLGLFCGCERSYAYAFLNTALKYDLVYRRGGVYWISRWGRRPRRLEDKCLVDAR
jgi:hypothetical protein